MNGFQVAPAELEAVLLENEHIADAGVVGIKLFVFSSLLQFLSYTNISTVAKKSCLALTSPFKRLPKEKCHPKTSNTG